MWSRLSNFTGKRGEAPILQVLLTNDLLGFQVGLALHVGPSSWLHTFAHLCGISFVWQQPCIATKPKTPRLHAPLPPRYCGGILAEAPPPSCSLSQTRNTHHALPIEPLDIAHHPLTQHSVVIPPPPQLVVDQIEASHAIPQMVHTLTSTYTSY